MTSLATQTQKGAANVVLAKIQKGKPRKITYKINTHHILPHFHTRFIGVSIIPDLPLMV